MKNDRKREPSERKVSPSRSSASSTADSAQKKSFLSGNESVELVGNAMRSIFDAIPHAVIGLRERHVVFANEGVKHVFGWDPRELTGQNTRVLYRTDEEYEEIGRRFYPSLEENMTHIAEYPCRRRDGKDITCMVWATRVGDVLRDRMIVVTYADITERKQAGELLQRSHDYLEQEIGHRTEELRRQVEEQKRLAEELQRSDGKYRQLTETAQDYILFIDLSGNVRYANKALQKVSGYGEDDLLKLNLEDLATVKYHPLIRERIMKRAAGDDSLYLTEIELITKYRKIIPVEVSSSLMKERERPIGMLIVARNISERRLMEDVLKESEARYRQLFEGIADPVVVFALDEEKVIDCNEAAARFYGYSYEEFLNLNPVVLLHPDFRERRKEVLKKLAKGEIIFAGSVHLRKDGRRVPVEFNGRTVDYKGRRVILATIRDNSQHQQMEDTLEESRERLELALYGGDLGMYDLQVESGRFYANERYWEMIGYRQGEMEVNFDSWSSMVHPEDLNRVLRIYSDHHTGKTDIFSTECRMRHKSGAWKWILIRGKIVTRDAEGNPTRVTGTHQDITEIRGAEKALAESEDRFRRIVEITSDVIWEVDEHERITYISPRIKNVTGYEPEEMLGRTIFNFMNKGDAARDDAAFQAIKERRQALVFLEHKMHHKNGGEVIFEFSGYPFFDADGNFRGYRGSSRDVTRRRHAESELRKKEKDLERTNLSLQEANTALRVLLKHQEDDKHELEEKIVTNLNKLVIPYVEKLKLTKMDEYQAACLDIVENNLTNVISPFVYQMTQRFLNLTPREIQIANHIKEGQTSKDIAKIMNVSISAIELHRNHIRNKFGLNNKKVNLRSYLLSLA